MSSKPAPSSRALLPPRASHLLLCATIAALSGCHSAFVQATIVNRTGSPVHLVEVDYPNASFGTEELAPGATFKYRFKILGDGATKLTWTDSHQKEHSGTGPDLREGQEGTLEITLAPDSTATWVPSFTTR